MVCPPCFARIAPFVEAFLQPTAENLCANRQTAGRCTSSHTASLPHRLQQVQVEYLLLRALQLSAHQYPRRRRRKPLGVTTEMPLPQPYLKLKPVHLVARCLPDTPRRRRRKCQLNDRLRVIQSQPARPVASLKPSPPTSLPLPPTPASTTLQPAFWVTAEVPARRCLVVEDSRKYCLHTPFSWALLHEDVASGIVLPSASLLAWQERRPQLPPGSWARPLICQAAERSAVHLYGVAFDPAEWSQHQEALGPHGTCQVLQSTHAPVAFASHCHMTMLLPKEIGCSVA